VQRAGTGLARGFELGFQHGCSGGVALLSAGDVARGHPAVHVVHIHEEWHRPSSLP
jgi:hypothetical protein